MTARLGPPAMLAEAAASLDVLSGGRVELGLGAGTFWDAIEAMGGPRRSPGAERRGVSARASFASPLLFLVAVRKASAGPCARCLSAADQSVMRAA